MNLIVTPTALVLAVALVLIALGVSLKQHLGLERDLVIGVVRAVIQLTVVGYVLTYVIKINRAPLTILMVAIIVVNAALNARKRAGNLPHAFAISLAAIGAATTITLVILIATHAIKFIPSQVVPFTGMIASNAMVAIGLAYRSMNASFHDLRQPILERLALGADAKQATAGLVRRAVKTGMSPTVDSAKTVGLVSLPGMMSGLIFAGVDPSKAIMYQILVTFMMLATTSISSVIACSLAYRGFFNERLQLQ
ncbi:ABC transporter permease [Lacticaseibacillus pantheris]|uniref:ABC transporter permease n=1 Tax=Lacticaseibacillus pantheris TaxID=171523 RepID=UPI0026587261|nr:iron export ABC transporter permease subunit FetB [Lacticaseibacillus pantheris]WKF85318.1 iron export ABC transporter permease subunit FetB [Lacticaseibacillus pantheris]